MVTLTHRRRAFPSCVNATVTTTEQTKDGEPVKAEKEPVKPQVKLADVMPKTAAAAAPAPALWKQAAIPLIIIAVGVVLRFYFAS